jgi:hypothetical protein
VVEKVASVKLMISRYEPIGGGTFIKTPDRLKAKKSLLNIKNEDNRCFMWSILAQLHLPENTHRSRVKQYEQFENELDMTGVSYPVKLSQISRVEAQNSLSINVFGWDEDDKGHGFFPIRISEVEGREINLLLISEDEKQHYVAITNLSGLLSKRSKKKCQAFYCHRCLHGFVAPHLLQRHVEDCRKLKVQRTEMPKDDFIQFNSYKKTIKHAVYMSVDFESLVVKTEQPEGAEQPKGSDHISSTTKTTVHKPCAYALQIESEFPEWRFPEEVYRGPDTAEHFITRCHAWHKKLQPILQSNVPMKHISNAHRNELMRKKSCIICEELFKTTDKKHLDHCHYTGKVNGFAHAKCNMEKQTPKHLPIVIHNFKVGTLLDPLS